MDDVLNWIAALCVVALLVMCGWAFGRDGARQDCWNQASAERAQIVRDLKEYPLGKPRLRISTEGITAACDR